ncbi:LysR substrate-binding domain-containing protein, partial [uncultured Pseudacidovorax sp.]|uniref:LysR substrate-binding domain-containing protein n=1 Tax=uncultured Pseudacidovorax sp. TaxID=679313 RepID=UPI0025EC0AB3
LTLRFAMEQGVGIGFLPDYLCREAVQSGALLKVVPDWQPPLGIVHAMFPPRRALVPAVRAVLDFLTEVLGTGEPPA